MSDDQNQNLRPSDGPDSDDGTRITSIAPASVSVEGGETTRNVVIGALLNHTYRVDALLARGGMGEVYKATHVELGTEHAIKVILPELTDNSRVVDMFRREAASLRNVRDDAVVAYDGVFRDEHGRLYLVMEFVSGPSLSDRLRQGALGPEEVLLLRDRIAGGLAAAHEKGIIHRDMSPDNVILPGGRLDHAKILDFGIAKLTDPDAKTIIGDDFAGKYSYVSPEQLGMFGGVVDARSDIYSVGLVLAAAARGRPLDMGMSPLTVVEARRSVPDLSDIAEEVRGPLSHMLQPDPKDRPQTMAEVIGARGSAAAESFRQVPGDQTQIAVTRGTASRGRARSSRPEVPARQSRSAVGLAAAVGVAAMLAGGAGYYFLYFKPSAETVQTARTEAPRLVQAEPSQLTPATPLAPAGPVTAPTETTPSETVTAPAPQSPSSTTTAAATSEPPNLTAPIGPPPGPAAATPSGSPLPSPPEASGAAPSTTASGSGPRLTVPTTAPVPPAPAAPAPQMPTAVPAGETPSGTGQPTTTAMVAPPVPPPPAQTTPAIAPPPSMEEQRQTIDSAIRSFSCARLNAAPVNGVWMVSGFVSAPQDLQRLREDLAAGGITAARIQAEVFQRPLCEVADMLHANTNVRRDDGTLRLGVNSPDRTFHDGDQLVVEVTSQISPERFLYVSYVDKEGNILHLLPKPGRTDNKASAGKTLHFGQQKEYMISPPFGTDMIFAVASPVKLFDKVRPEQEAGAKYFADLHAALRKYNPTGAAGSIVSNYILITTSP